MYRDNLFNKAAKLIIPFQQSALLERFEESKEITEKALVDNNPYAVCLMLSGGDDSVTALQVALMLGVKIDFIIHGVTGTGLKDVRNYVRCLASEKGIRLIEADAGNAFEDYVKRKGFFGRGTDAHKYSYHVLKSGPFEAAISKHIIKRKPGRKLILLNGVRVEESENRADNFGDNPYRWRKNMCWVNIIHWWSKKECLELLQAEGVRRNPVAVCLGRSGECNCGTMQNDADRMAVAEYDKEWGEWMYNLRKYAIAKFGWDINQNPSKKRLEEIKATNLILSEDMPMCVGCKARTATLF